MFTAIKFSRVAALVLVVVLACANGLALFTRFVPGYSRAAEEWADDWIRLTLLNVALASCAAALLVLQGLIGLDARRRHRACCKSMDAARSGGEGVLVHVTGRRLSDGDAEVWLTALGLDADGDRTRGRTQITHCPWCGYRLAGIRWDVPR